LHELIMIEREQFKERIQDIEGKEKELENEEYDFEARY